MRRGPERIVLLSFSMLGSALSSQTRMSNTRNGRTQFCQRGIISYRALFFGMCLPASSRRGVGVSRNLGLACWEVLRCTLGRAYHIPFWSPRWCAICCVFFFLERFWGVLDEASFCGRPPFLCISYGVGRDVTTSRVSVQAMQRVIACFVPCRSEGMV